MGQNTGQFIWRPKYIGSSTKYLVTAQREWAHPCLSMTTLKQFYIADRGMWLNNTKGPHCWIYMTITVKRNRNNGVLCIHCIYCLTLMKVVYNNIHSALNTQTTFQLQFDTTVTWLLSYFEILCFTEMLRLKIQDFWNITPCQLANTEIYFQLKQSECLMNVWRPLERR